MGCNSFQFSKAICQKCLWNYVIKMYVVKFVCYNHMTHRLIQ